MSKSFLEVVLDILTISAPILSGVLIIVTYIFAGITPALWLSAVLFVLTPLWAMLIC